MREESINNRAMPEDDILSACDDETLNKGIYNKRTPKPLMLMMMIVKKMKMKKGEKKRRKEGGREKAKMLRKLASSIRVTRNTPANEDIRRPACLLGLRKFRGQAVQKAGGSSLLVGISERLFLWWIPHSPLSVDRQKLQAG
jgi:hypothetical protein